MSKQKSFCQVLTIHMSLINKTALSNIDSRDNWTISLPLIIHSGEAALHLNNLRIAFPVTDLMALTEHSSKINSLLWLCGSLLTFRLKQEAARLCQDEWDWDATSLFLLLLLFPLHPPSFPRISERQRTRHWRAHECAGPTNTGVACCHTWPLCILAPGPSFSLPSPRFNLCPTSNTR